MEATYGPIPDNNDDQMNLGLRIIQGAAQQQAHFMEQEISRIRMTNEEQKASIGAMQKKNSTLEVELVESHTRTQQLNEEKKELNNTRDQLARQIKRLDVLKQAVLSSIQNDSEEAASLGEAKHLMNDDFLRGAIPLTSAELGLGMPAANSPQQSRQVGGGFGANTSPAAAVNYPFNHAGHQPYAQPAAAQPALAEPVASAPAPIDGKQFFRNARARLSQEEFQRFLGAIKRLNNQQQSREETLEEARSLFGREAADLYRDFEALLTRQAL